MAGAFDDLIAQYSQGGNLSVRAGEGRAALGSAEAKAAEADITQAQLARNVLRMYANMLALNDGLPTGRFSAAVSEAQGRLPSGWQPKHLPLYQVFRSLARQSLLPSANLISGQPLGASQVNSPAEYEIWEQAVVNPRLEPEAVRQVSNNLSRLALERIARSSFNQAWRQKYGSTNAPNESGEPIEVVWSRFLSSERAAGIRRPMSEYVQDARARRAGGRPAVSGQTDIDALVRKYAH